MAKRELTLQQPQARSEATKIVVHTCASLDNVSGLRYTENGDRTEVRFRNSAWGGVLNMFESQLVRRVRFKWRAAYDERNFVAIVATVVRTAFSRLRRLDRRELWVALLAYGSIVAVIACGRIADRQPTVDLNLQRGEDLSMGVEVVRHGGVPLAGIKRESGSLRYYPLAYNDDRGAYVYLPVIGSLAKSSTVTSLMRWSFLALLALIFVLYPLLFFEITGSLLVALASPWVIWWKFAWIEEKGVYWIPGWCVLLCLPMVLLVYNRWNRWSLPVLALLVTLGSFASSIRANAGLPILLAAVAVSFARVRPWRQRFAFFAVLLVASMSISGAAMSAIQHQRDALLESNLSENYPMAHPTWHSIYIGLGYLPNKYGIRWKDSSAFDYVKAVRPEASPYSTTYESVLRQRYFEIAFHDPAFVARTYLVKTGVVVRQMFRRYWLLLPVVLGVLAFTPRRNDLHYSFLIMLLAMAGAAVPAIVTTPDLSFELGLLAACVVAALASVGWLAALVEGQLRLRLVDLRHFSVRTVTVAVSLALILSAFAFYPGTGNAEAVNFYRTNQSSLASPKVADAREVHSWRFGNGTAGWSSNPGMRTLSRPGADELVVRTDPTPYSYNLSSPIHVLPPGQYETRLRGRVMRGGLMLGVLDQTRHHWIRTSFYWSGQPGYEQNEMAVSFTLANPAQVRVILANVGLHSNRSVWRLKTVREVRTYLASCAINTNGAWYPLAPGPAGGQRYG